MNLVVAISLAFLRAIIVVEVVSVDTMRLHELPASPKTYIATCAGTASPSRPIPNHEQQRTDTAGSKNRMQHSWHCLLPIASDLETQSPSLSIVQICASSDLVSFISFQNPNHSHATAPHLGPRACLDHNHRRQAKWP